MKLYRPSPASRALYVSSDDLGDLTAVVLEEAVVISPANCVLTSKQITALFTAEKAARFIRGGHSMPGVELVEGFPPEWADQVEPEEVPA